MRVYMVYYAFFFIFPLYNCLFIVDPFLDHLVVVVVEDLCSLKDLKRYHQHAITNMQTTKKKRFSFQFSK